MHKVEGEVNEKGVMSRSGDQPHCGHGTWQQLEKQAAIASLWAAREIKKTWNALEAAVDLESEFRSSCRGRLDLLL